MFIITGGGSGIGRALALELGTRGKEVLIIGRDRQKLAAVTDENSQIKSLPADVTTVAGREIITDFVRDQIIEGLVHNAGVIQPIVPITEIELADWQKCMATNLDAPLFLTQALLQNLTGGRVLHIGSGAAHFSVTGWTAYCVSKAALFRLTESWQMEVDSISVSSVKPGIIDTAMQKEIREANNMDPCKQDFFLRLHAENKLIAPEVVASFLAWLLLEVPKEQYIATEWDIYDESHHEEWLPDGAAVPGIE